METSETTNKYVCLNCGGHQTSFGDGICPECDGPVVVSKAGDDELEGRVLAQKYKLIKEIGRGGMGSVFRGRHLQLDKEVAIKVLRLTDDEKPKSLRRFYAEAKNTARLSHPNNVKVFDFGHTEDGVLFIVMELVSGVPLSSIALPLSPLRALRIASQICGALGEAHNIGLIHRDLKPGNVMISQVDGKDFTRVLDYGIAKFEGTPSLTSIGKVIGTPRYLSPEQITGKPLDARSDIFSLGLIIYEMITGEVPFKAPTSTVRNLAALYERPDPPSSHIALPSQIDDVVLSCLAKDREDRPGSANQLRWLLDRIIDGGDLNGMPAALPVAMAATTPQNPIQFVKGETQIQFGDPQGTRMTRKSEAKFSPPPKPPPPTQPVSSRTYGTIAVGVIIMGLVVFFVASAISNPPGEQAYDNESEPGQAVLSIEEGVTEEQPVANSNESTEPEVSSNTATEDIPADEGSGDERPVIASDEPGQAGPLVTEDFVEAVQPDEEDDEPETEVAQADEESEDPDDDEQSPPNTEAVDGESAEPTTSDELLEEIRRRSEGLTGP